MQEETLPSSDASCVTSVLYCSMQQDKHVFHVLGLCLHLKKVRLKIAVKIIPSIHREENIHRKKKVNQRSLMRDFQRKFCPPEIKENWDTAELREKWKILISHAAQHFLLKLHLRTSSLHRSRKKQIKILDSGTVWLKWHLQAILGAWRSWVQVKADLRQAQTGKQCCRERAKFDLPFPNAEAL